jgi:hypothetical protein
MREREVMKGEEVVAEDAAKNKIKKLDFWDKARDRLVISEL